MNRTCPDCDLVLTPRLIQGVTIDTCAQCAGIFFDEGELNQIRVDGNHVLTELDESVTPDVQFSRMSEEPRRCPSCKTQMDKFRYLYNSPVLLDNCGNCGGVWVDNGELKAMRELLDHADQPTSPKSEMFSVLAELQVRTEENRARARRLERSMRFLNRWLT